eukprot:CAMPEP_0174251062 /NCGR_PEP_ID=MMETSP0439-20130205/1016_1 /TAXON_ID=0 /ORGANISM="Stereomyxa ramosa, Strain Chinc5" /LENGTH=564 /DNA_ID=CAMNT_0015331291 /DNA_START=96 /DNA_END=1790 /DNA_ORIENTATION=+
MRGSNNRLNGNGVNRANNNRMCDTQNNAKGGYAYGPPMYYHVGSQVTIEWTNQHGCGPKSSQKNLDCQLILQYMCGDEVRDGTTTTTIPDNEETYNTKEEDTSGDFGGGEQYLYGMHESYQFYQDCKTRERNKGLFTADRNVRGNDARFTRQNNNGARSGFECPEERDYYPYWHPTPWKDIAVLVSREEDCEYYRKNSENKKGRNYCTVSAFNNQPACLANGGQWKKADKHSKVPNVDCVVAPMSRDNHLGNGVEGWANTYNWTVPDDVNNHCVLRLRYNISTGDYSWNTFADRNGPNSPVRQDPYVDFGGKNLSLAIDTSQFGRTFQDRSHSFAIKNRPDGVAPADRIFNINVRGKRGNIVQVYPAVEYDFVPNYATLRLGDYVHFQWTGSDNNPAGNDGEGTRQTDRSNLVEFGTLDLNYPFKKSQSSFFDSSQAMRFAHLDQKDCLTLDELKAKNGNNQNNIEQDVQNCAKLNAADRYFDGGIKKIDKTGSFYFMSTRNNNFSNRSQKSTIVVVDFLPIWAIVLVVLGGVLCLLSVVFSSLALFGKFRPNSAVGRVYKRLI